MISFFISRLKSKSNAKGRLAMSVAQTETMAGDCGKSY
jgi:hypothetical protein